ncbi:hypothetical protein IW492_09355 [Enterococcus sp. BWB1-3]|uniref:hypothetical protein n=1 Tax=unclassified Enterococcus TaxID=2608891 RepID=UPI00192425B1|nr:MULTISPECIES: hypothetical protein [unclassified Enterococcus]MBL1229436.1 hypothetical protein [Enterococcus sp. BWB1-3]MCB5952609.1 hypothetical protein [Enterococcus sp. BWT-B8]
MGNPAQVTRRYSRFPAFDDEVGVKITPETKRYLFKDESSMLQSSDGNTTMYAEMDAATQNKPKTNPSQAAGRSDLKPAHTKEQIEELKKHKLNLPDYTINRSRAAERQKKPNLFGNMHKKSKENFETAAFNKRTTTRKVTSFGEPKKQDQTYFVPTYVPASVIPDQPAEEAIISDQELLAAMRKEPKSYLLMDHEDTQFKEKKENDPSVQKFNVPKETPEIPLTRRQYQQIRPNMKRFDLKGEENLPRSRSELKSAKEQAKNQTAYGQKVSEAEQEQKKGILDKSLSGIIEDSHAEMENTKYFS